MQLRVGILYTCMPNRLDAGVLDLEDIENLASSTIQTDKWMLENDFSPLDGTFNTS